MTQAVAPSQLRPGGLPTVRADTEPVLLQRVMATRHLRSVYQPIVRLSDRRIIAFEAFARTASHADDGSVAHLFKEAMASGEIRDLDWLCRRTAILGARDTDPRVDLHVNVSVRGVSDPLGDAHKMASLALSCGRHPEEIVVDVTDALSTDPAHVAVAQVAYRREGFQIAMDGVSSARFLEFMPALAPDIVKLDHALAADLGRPATQRLVVQTLETARRMGATVIAQGIEEEWEAESFCELGVTVGAGYLLGRPGPIEPIVAALAS